MNGDTVKEAWKNSFTQVKGAAIALLFGVAMVYIFRNSANDGIQVSYMIDGRTAGLGSMLTMMADGLGSIFRGAYIVIAPLIGVLGSFMSGSNTVSNTLFSSLQFETATLVGLPQVIIVALQNNGGVLTTLYPLVPQQVQTATKVRLSAQTSYHVSFTVSSLSLYL